MGNQLNAITSLKIAKAKTHQEIEETYKEVLEKLGEKYNVVDLGENYLGDRCFPTNYPLADAEECVEHIFETEKEKEKEKVFCSFNDVLIYYVFE